MSAATVERLRDLLVEASEGDVTPPVDTSGADSIRRLGLTSVRLMAFLVAVEDEFGFEWDEDLDPAVISGFEAMAAYVESRTGAGVA